MNWDGDSFAIISDDHTNMNGSFGPGDAERLKKIRKQAGTDILWFRRGSGEYVIKDPAVVAQAKQAIHVRHRLRLEGGPHSGRRDIAVSHASAPLAAAQMA